MGCISLTAYLEYNSSSGRYATPSKNVEQIEATVTANMHSKDDPLSYQTLVLAQWNLFIADMLYSGHLSIMGTLYKNRWNHGHSLIEKTHYSGQK